MGGGGRIIGLKGITGWGGVLMSYLGMKWKKRIYGTKSRELCSCIIEFHMDSSVFYE